MSNHFTITGNLGRDGLGALRFTPSGQAVLGFSIADTPRRRNAAGEWEDAGDTLWVEVSVWGEDAEALAENHANHRGRVTVTGRLGVRKYDAKDGTPRTVTTLRADSVALHAPRQGQGQGQGFDAQSNPGGGWGQPSGGQGASGWGPPAVAEPPFSFPPVVISGEGRAW